MSTMTTLTLEELLAPPVDKPLAVDFNHPARRLRLRAAISGRIGTAACRKVVHGQVVLEQAGERYFSLVGRAQQSLRGRFTEAELDCVLNVECTSVWNWDADLTVATMVADDNGVEASDELEPQSGLRQLLDKLLELSPLENAALVDACEQVWRGYENPLLQG